MRDLQLQSLRPRAADIQGLRVLLFGFSGKGFPGGDGALEAIDVLPKVGIEATYTHALDPELGSKLDQGYDVVIVTNTRVGELLRVDRRLWSAGGRSVLWFWDLRPGSVGAPLRGLVDWAFLTFCGRWEAPGGVRYAPEDWAASLECEVGYCPQASPLREPTPAPGGPRVLFVGDVHNRTYHQGRADIARMLGALVVNEKERARRLLVEASLPVYYPSARYCLSMSPQAPGYTSVRTYSILACGGLMLLHAFPGCERLFRDGEHVITFEQVDEHLLERLEVLDRDEAARAQIAAAGRRLHARSHTVAHRVLSICRQVTGVATEFSGWL